jgi:cation transport regulator ChaC
VDSGTAEFVFGYGSLLSREPSERRSRTRPAHLDGFRRTWNIAMDNRVDLPGYKYYRDPDGSRPPVFVTFLNLRPAPGARVNGVVYELTAQELRALDLRERNYERVEVTDHVAEASAGRVWTYVGRDDARERYETGLTTHRAVVSREYYDEVSLGFASLGAGALDEYTATTDPPACPVRDLERIDLPGATNVRSRPS